LPDKGDNSIEDAEQYEVEVTQDQDYFRADRETREKETPVDSEAAETPDRGDGCRG